MPGEKDMDGDKIQTILNLLTEEQIAKRIGLKHDLARSSFQLETLTVKDAAEFHAILNAYIKHHLQTIGKSIDALEVNTLKTRGIDAAFGRAGLEEAYEMARTGARGGLRIILDKFCDFLKEEQVRSYINYVIDSCIDPLSWEAKVEFMNEYFGRFGRFLPKNMKPPESFANNYKEFIIIASQVYNKMREGKIQY